MAGPQAPEGFGLEGTLGWDTVQSPGRERSSGTGEAQAQGEQERAVPVSAAIFVLPRLLEPPGAAQSQNQPSRSLSVPTRGRARSCSCSCSARPHPSAQVLPVLLHLFVSSHCCS